MSTYDNEPSAKPITRESFERAVAEMRKLRPLRAGCSACRGFASIEILGRRLPCCPDCGRALA